MVHTLSDGARRYDAPIVVPQPVPGARAWHWYRPLSQFVYLHEGRAAVIAGGGVSLPEHLSRAPADAVYFSANAHLVKLRRPDFIVGVDDIEPKLRAAGVTVVGSRRWADIRVMEQTVAGSGVMAAYVAWAMGCAPIVLAGMDCYVGGTYHDDPEARSSGNGLPTAQHVLRWDNLMRQCQGIELATLGGPLEELMPLWPRVLKTGERSLEFVRHAVAGVRVRFLKADKIGRNHFKRGDEWEISKNEARERCLARICTKMRADVRPC